MVFQEDANTKINSRRDRKLKTLKNSIGIQNLAVESDFPKLNSRSAIISCGLWAKSLTFLCFSFLNCIIRKVVTKIN